LAIFVSAISVFGDLIFGNEAHNPLEVIDEGTSDHFPILFSSPFTAAENGFCRKTNWKIFTFFLSLVSEYWNACVYNLDEQFFFTLFSTFLSSLWDRTENMNMAVVTFGNCPKLSCSEEGF
jgi:hypothetical protein